jgi:group I intron endonuclease
MAEVAHLYKITNTMNNMVYIGVTKYPKHRMNAHACYKIPTKSIIKNAIKKYGRDKFTLQILITSTQEYCYEMEHKAIESYNTLKPNGYNICTGGMGAIGIFGEKNGMYGRKHSPETLEKMRQIKLGKKLSEETKLKMGISHTGGKKTPEQCRKISDKKKLMWQDPEYKAKMNAAGFGKRKKSQVQ